MNIQTHPRQYVTPPDNSTSLFFTPPPTPTSLVSRIIDEIKNRQKGRNLTNTPWVVYSLDLKKYQELQHEFQKDQSLCGFAQHKLRYN